MSDFFQDDEVLGKAYDSRLMKRLLKYVRPYRAYIILAIFLNILTAALEPVRPYLTKIAVDKYISVGDSKGLINIILLILLSLLLQAIINYAMTFATQYMGQRTLFDLRMEIFEHLQKLALKFFDRTPIGRLVTRVTNDVESLSELFSSGIVMIFSDVFIIVWIFVFMILMSFDLALVTMSVVPVLIYATFLFRKKVRANYRDVRKHLARLNSYMQEHISGMSVVQMFNKEEKEFEKFKSINKDYRDANIQAVLYHAVFYPAVELISAIAVGLIIWYGGGEVVKNNLTLGVLFAFIQYTEMFFRPVRDLAEKYNILQTGMASSERIFKLLDTKIFIKQPENPVPLKDVKGKVEFKNVWFAYNDEEYVLKDISFLINPGESVAIVGATGAGKSSIINLLLRFYDINKGQILIDDVDISQVDEKELRRHIALVLQDVILFSGDVKSNINLWNEEIPFDKVIEASKIVGADQFIEKLPNKYDEEVKERGATLSLGQKQLISFARALAYDPKILILDEATASIDTESEKMIQQAIARLLKGRTSIVIAHRLSTIQNSDKIIVLHKGQIREMGNHYELLEKKGIYYRLYQLQYKDQQIIA
ncbi:MAG: ABC transporter ATP-binding protein/permease [Ignavibacteria bacterium]|jgi:ATP-binding cassette subfamily B protein|nr:ABC transporter ATP-binding protein/permease [Ignavibacteria bacterium]MDH7528866.1 ABC transporter ATP-binding protein [Ignavibacteria bacterium]